ncbi:uncharacterized protein BJ212DRAFT_1345433, partial [Suillus subaureus]
MNMPCITMVEAPHLLLGAVTKALSDAAISCRYPSDRTEVLKCEACEVASMVQEAPQCRGIALQYYLAFKSLAKATGR